MSYEQLREQKIKEIGGKTLRAGEEFYEKHQAQPLVTVQNAITGQKEEYKKDVADVFLRKKTHEKSKLVFSVPYLPFLHDKKED